MKARVGILVLFLSAKANQRVEEGGEVAVAAVLIGARRGNPTR